MTNLTRSAAMFRMVEDLFPLHRSMTGEGSRETFRYLQQHIPLSLIETKSGTRVFDWHVPQEWSIRDAYIADQSGERLVDYRVSNLHVGNDSVAVPLQTMSWEKLSPHVVSLPDRPSAVPYRTAYFRDDWSFCVTQAIRDRLASHGGPFQVCIDSEHFDGALTYAECTLPGISERSVLIHCHTCHPSLANDNLSGVVVATFLAKALSQRKRRLTYRFVFAPATIGAITWLAANEHSVVPMLDHGLILTLLGNDAPFTLKKSRRGDTPIDRTGERLMKQCGGASRDFSPIGYDERQFCSPGFNLPVATLSRTPFAEFPEYHTSDDNLSFVSGRRLEEALDLCVELLDELETQSIRHPTAHVPMPSASVDPDYPVNLLPKCEPRLGKHGLHQAFGRRESGPVKQETLMWVLSLSDGRHSPAMMAQRAGIAESDILKAISVLAEISVIDVSKNHDPLPL